MVQRFDQLSSTKLQLMTLGSYHLLHSQKKALWSLPKASTNCFANPTVPLSAPSRDGEIKFIDNTEQNSIALIDSDISLNEVNHFTLVTSAQHFTLKLCYSTH